MNWLKRMGVYWNRPNHAAYLFIAPAVLIIFVFAVLPLFTSFVISSLNVNTLFSNTRFIGFDNYIRMFQDARYINSWRITLLFTLFDVPFSIAFSLLIAFLVNGSRLSDKFFRAVYVLPLIISSTVTGMMWKLFLNPNIGWGTALLERLGFGKVAIFNDPSIAVYGIIFVAIWSRFGMSSMILVAAIQGVDKGLYEAADIDGATKIRQFFSITIPGIASTLWFVLITRVIGSFQVFDLVYIITRGGPGNSTQTVVNYIFSRSFGDDNKLGYSTAMSEGLFVVILVISLLLYGRMIKQERSGGFEQ